MTSRRTPDVPPALIDRPGPFSPLTDSVAFRAELDLLDIPHLGPFKHEADRIIEHLAAIDLAATSALTRQQLDWKPTGPGVLTDLRNTDFGVA